MSVSFADLAQTKVGQVERPKLYPIGKYRGVITGPAKEHKARSGNFALRFPWRVVEMVEGDEEALAEMGGVKADREEKLDFWMSPDARYRFTEFASSLGVGNDDMNLIELAEAVSGSGNTFLIDLTHRQDEEKPDVFYPQWGDPAGEAA